MEIISPLINCLSEFSGQSMRCRVDFKKDVVQSWPGPQKSKGGEEALPTHFQIVIQSEQKKYEEAWDDLAAARCWNVECSSVIRPTLKISIFWFSFLSTPSIFPFGSSMWRTEVWRDPPSPTFY